MRNRILLTVTIFPLVAASCSTPHPTTKVAEVQQPAPARASKPPSDIKVAEAQQPAPAKASEPSSDLKEFTGTWRRFHESSPYPCADYRIGGQSGRNVTVTFKDSASMPNVKIWQVSFQNKKLVFHEQTNVDTVIEVELAPDGRLRGTETISWPSEPDKPTVRKTWFENID